MSSAGPNWNTAKGEALWLEGKSGTFIGEALGVSRSAVIGHMNRRGLHRGNPAHFEWTPARDVTLTERYLAGDALNVIAGAVGSPTRSAVSGRIARLGLKRPEALSQANRRAVSSPNSGMTGSWGLSRVADALPPSLELVAEANTAPAEPAALKTLSERGMFDCSFPVGSPDPKRGQLYCGAATAVRFGYCPACAARMRGNTGRTLTRISGSQVGRANRPAEPASDSDTDLFGMIA